VIKGSSLVFGKLEDPPFASRVSHLSSFLSTLPPSPPSSRLSQRHIRNTRSFGIRAFHTRGALRDFLATCVLPLHVSTVGTDHAYESSCLRLSGLRPDRRSKIKCRHEGSAPCHACNIASREDCLLSAPVVKGRSYPVGYEGPSVRLRDSTDAHTFPPTKRPRVSSFHISHRANYVQPLLDPTVGCPDLPTPTLMLQACELLQAHFPEFGFLHRPSFVDQLLEGSVETARLHAILSVTARFMPGLVSQHGGPEAAGEFYAVKAETSVMLRVLDSPDPATVQSLLLISLHHWGACNGTRAWMLAGTSHLSRGMVLSLTMIQASGSGWRKR
jgi:hypothetical protein